MFSTIPTSVDVPPISATTHSFLQARRAAPTKELVGPDEIVNIGYCSV
nr:hypothetical protein [Wolbachia endosymbiont (group A) of Lasioglossum morio]